jgi:tRNA A37 threonylcarbamoyladenosine modification protein TsaB
LIVAFSTSSRVTSVALLGSDGTVAWAGSEHAPQRASGACISLLERALAETGARLEEATAFAADLGPGSFTGVRVGIVMAKTFAFVYGRPCIGADSFDLISPTGTVVLPSKKGEYFIRRVGEAPVRTTELPAEPYDGFGFAGGDTFPDAARFAPLVSKLQPMAAEALVPAYLIEPSISVPKKPFPGVNRG